MHVRVRPRSLEESKRQEELGVEYDKLEVGNLKVQIGSVIKNSHDSLLFFFHARQSDIVVILYFRDDFSYSK